MKHLTAKITIGLLTALFMTTSCQFFNQSDADTSSPTTTEEYVFPEPLGYISDFEDLLTDEQEEDLTEILMHHEAATTDEIFIVTLKSLDSYDNIFDYSLDLANYWGFGQNYKNNGILIALSKGLGKIRIQNGEGIEDRLSDAKTKQNIEEAMFPEFISNNNYEGLKKGVGTDY